MIEPAYNKHINTENKLQVLVAIIPIVRSFCRHIAYQNEEEGAYL